MFNFFFLQLLSENIFLTILILCSERMLLWVEGWLILIHSYSKGVVESEYGADANALHF